MRGEGGGGAWCDVMTTTTRGRSQATRSPAARVSFFKTERGEMRERRAVVRRRSRFFLLLVRESFPSTPGQELSRTCVGVRRGRRRNVEDGRGRRPDDDEQVKRERERPSPRRWFTPRCPFPGGRHQSPRRSPAPSPSPLFIHHLRQELPRPLRITRPRERPQT